MEAIVDVVLPVFAIILTGYAAGRFGVLGPAAASALNAFVYLFALPALLFNAMAGVDAARIFDVPFIAAYVGGTAVVFAAGLVIAKVAFRARLDEGAVFAMTSIFSNTGYMGIPLAIAAFGEEAALPAVIITVFQTILFVAVPTALIEFSRRSGSLVGALATVGLALAKNPIIMAPIAGILFAILQVPLPTPVVTYLDIVGAAAGPGALVAIGLFLVGKPVRQGSSEVGVMVLLKLIGHPALIWVLATHVFQVQPMWALVAVIMAALPSGANCFVIAERYQVYIQRASTAILVSTALAAITVSGLFALLIR